MIEDDAGETGRTAADPRPDGHGEAALLLVESLIHALIARAALTLAEALEIVQVAIDAQIEIDDDRGEPGGTPPPRPLDAILATLRTDA